MRLSKTVWEANYLTKRWKVQALANLRCPIPTLPMKAQWTAEQYQALVNLNLWSTMKRINVLAVPKDVISLAIVNAIARKQTIVIRDTTGEVEVTVEQMREVLAFVYPPGSMAKMVHTNIITIGKYQFEMYLKNTPEKKNELVYWKVEQPDDLMKFLLTMVQDVLMAGMGSLIYRR